MYLRRTLLWILGLGLILFWTPGLEAQLNRGEIEGIVTDPQGAVVPEVSITITNVDTNVSVNTKSNGAGSYLAVDLVPGKYRLHFEHSGFSPLDLTDIELPAGKVTRVDTTLKLAQTRQAVEVKAEVPLLETAASNFSTTLESRIIEDIPLAGRDLMQLVFLVPGVNSVAGPPGSNFGFSSEFGTFPDATNVLGSNLSVNGGQAGANAWYLDGNLNLSSFAENVAVNPSPDAVSEFQMIGNAFAAEYSRTGGAVFNVVLKSGSNALHGNIYEFSRQSATNARNPFTSVGVDPFTGKSGVIKDRQLHYNNFGATLGGPVVFPKLYNGKDRTFFFFSWDIRVLHLLGQQTFTVPTARMRQGDFSEDPNAAQFGVWDPYSTSGPDANGFFARSAFGTAITPNGCTGFIDPSTGLAVNPTASTCNFSTQVPSDRFDSIATTLVGSYPLPNANDLRSSCPMGKDGFIVCDNFKGAVGTTQVPHNISLKIDHQWSPYSKWFFEWLYNPGKYRNYRVPWTGLTYPGPLVGFGSTVPLDFKNQIFGLGNTYTFTSSFFNEFHYNFSRQLLNTKSGTTDAYNKIGALKPMEQLLAPVRLPSTEFYPIPSFYISTPEGGNLQFGIPGFQNANVMSEAHTILDNVTKVIGRHTLKAGFTYRLEHSAWDSTYPTFLDFFGGLVTNPITHEGGGSGLAQFLMGATDPNGSATGLWIGSYMRWRYYGAYLQDDFRITPRFSLNVGLRWDMYGQLKARWHPNSNFCLSCPNPLTHLVGKVIYEGDPEYPINHDQFPANKDNFGPRFNFSWAPSADRKTVIRGGYNIFTSNAANAANFPGGYSSPGWQPAGVWSRSFYPDKCASFYYQCVAFPLSDTTTDKSQTTFPPLTAGFPAQKRDPVFAQFLFINQKPSREPTVQVWGLEIERQLPSDMLLSLGYVGNHGTHLFSEYAYYDFVHTRDVLKYRTALNDDIPISDVLTDPVSANKLAEVYGSSDLQRGLLLRTYHGFYFPNQGASYDGTDVYHGLNVRLQKRFSHGLNFNVAYTFSKKMTNANVANLGAELVDAIHGAASPGGRANNVVFKSGYQDPDHRKDRLIGEDDVPQMLNVFASYELPFGSGKALLNRKGIASGVFGGWKLAANFNAQSGIPLPVFCPGNGITGRCNLIGNPKFSGSRSRAGRIAQWMNPAAFEPPFGSDPAVIYFVTNNAPPPGTSPTCTNGIAPGGVSNFTFDCDFWWRFGTMGPQIPSLRSPGFWNTDATLMKRFPITESKYLEFRWEVFNALNHQNLGLPNTSWCLPPLPDGTVDVVHQAGCKFGRITNIATDARTMEFGLKFFW